MTIREEWLKKDGSSFPGKTYVECLLKPVFNDQRDYLFHAMFQVHRAHVLMLCEKEILPAEDAKKILQAVETIACCDYQQLEYDPRYEDLFFMMEARLTEEIGKELAGNMHIARSRNDMGVAMYRIVLRDRLLDLIDKVLTLREILLKVSSEHLETVMPAYTHTQPAQPTTLGHYLMAVHDVLERDSRRLLSAFQNVNQSPLGAAAITTTGFDICRDQVKESLGFTSMVENSYDAIAGADYLLETATVIIVLMTNLGRWIQDFLLFCTREFAAVRIADPYVQISSIMPQKRNPVSVEHSRSLASSAIADAQAVCTMIHNTPFGDIVDTEDDLQPHLYQSIDKCVRVLNLMSAVISTIEVNRNHLLQRAREGYITITELADAMVREKGISFRTAHQIASRVAKTAIQEGKELDDISPGMIDRVARDVIGYDLAFTAEELKRVCDPFTFIEIRKCPGGPSPVEARRMLDEREKRIRENRQDWQDIQRKLEAARTDLNRRVQELIEGR
ncbi:argininosuccinate lyase [Paenactinomyces guangxiensis]|uniref:Argininosuccinate lyase n=1 Tax=Paenactinomyces guangxiensis TaxID=1490290 RepID=A0A7W1WR72_9BACL|nr:argininosuccinate lyase [Paenactinomyces guangxiensis]MBA4494565.1 argininosuccinate lyase [Paenactinomyces guangxiensis]MBH8591672.1 argininosuccinate lyase [Paenactinomyces guangxiensis]